VTFVTLIGGFGSCVAALGAFGDELLTDLRVRLVLPVRYTEDKAVGGAGRGA